VFRTYGELFPERAQARDRPNHENPQLFTVFLSSGQRLNKRRPSLGFCVDLGVLVPEYEVNGKLFLNNHFPGGYIYREKINLLAIPPDSDEQRWRLRYGLESWTPARATRNVEPETPNAADGAGAPDRLEFRIPIEQKNRPGIDATLVLTATSWNDVGVPA
jgi:hypothetical protein